MIKIMTPIFLALALATPLAQAFPTITFSGVANGANVADFYNGGTDSLGYHGFNYGIHFDAIVANNVAGPYVRGGATMTFAANLFGNNVPFVIKLNAASNGVDGAPSYITGGANPDSLWVAGNGNPYCYTEAQCRAGGYYYVHPSQMGGYIMYSDGTETTVTFNTDRLDNIEFMLASDASAFVRPTMLSGSADLDRDIPEPTSIALLGIGLAGFAGMRRRRPGNV